MKNPVILLVASVLVLGVVTVAQAATCTGKCWEDSTGRPYCGFTAMTKGARCVAGATWYAGTLVYYCEEYACNGGAGFEEETQSEFAPQDDLLGCESVAAERLSARTAASVRVLAPRT